MKLIITVPFLFFNLRFYSAILNKINMSYWFRILVTPSCWMRNSGYKYDKNWDSLVNTLIDFGTITKVGYMGFDIKINDTWIWISNYPYCFGHPYNRDRKGNNKLTSRKTAFKLHDKLQKEWNLVNFWHLREPMEQQWPLKNF